MKLRDVKDVDIGGLVLRVGDYYSLGMIRDSGLLLDRFYSGSSWFSGVEGVYFFRNVSFNYLKLKFQYEGFRSYNSITGVKDECRDDVFNCFSNLRVS